MARTTIHLDDGVLRDLRARSAREHRPMGTIASELLAEAMHGRPTSRPALRWVSRSMGARVDLDDRDAVWELLDSKADG